MASAESSNNTNISDCVKKSRMYLLTINEKTIPHLYDILEYIENLKTCNYYICCSHNKGSNDDTKLHYHIAIQFTNTIKLSIKKLYGAHIDVGCYGSIQNMVKYVKGETGHDDIAGFHSEIIKEYGLMNKNGGYKIKDIRNMSSAEIQELPGNMIRCAEHIKNTYNAEELFNNMLDEIEKDNLQKPIIIYITGDSGSGKTYQAYKMALCMYEKSKIGKITIENNFFNIINNDAECYIIEEFRPSDCRASIFLQFTDCYGYSAPIKGGHQYIRPKCIIICSIIPSIDIYKNDEINKQFQRRITFEFNKNNENDLSRYGIF